MDKSSRGPSGGAGNEAGGAYRRGVAAFFVAHGLNGIAVEGLPIDPTNAVVEAVTLEADFPVDDVLVQLRSGRLFLQAKRTLNLSRPMQEVAAQWLRAIRDPAFMPASDLLAVASGDMSKRARALTQALHRARSGATSFSSDEQRAMLGLREILKRAGASPSEVEVVLSRAVVLLLQVESSEQEHSERGRLLLDGHVVTKGEGTKAWRELLWIAGDAARLRLGHSIPVWLEELRRKDVSLTRDVAASRAGYLTRRNEAIGRYRQQLCDRGEYVDLTAIGLAIPPIALSEMDADIPVIRQGADDPNGDDLLWTFRRRGRAVLTGLPGGGKSTCMAMTAAEWARREDWSLPIAISLLKLVDRDEARSKPLRDRVLEAAVEVLEPRDRQLVYEALDEAFANGNIVLFLDGLDEAADRGLALTSDIARLLKDVHPDTDVLVATRDVAYAHTQLLDFDDLRLSSPRDRTAPVEAVLRAIAVQRAIAGADVWVAIRVEWVKQAIARDSQLSETPLLPVLLASLAADRDTDELPRTRTLILERVIEDVVRRGEARRDIQVSGLPQGQHVEAVLGTFPLIAVTLTRAGGSAPRAHLADQVASYLQADWGLPAGGARATAKQILVFWDESGIFVASGAEKVVTPRHRLFLETGAALYIASRPDDEGIEWVAAMAAKSDAIETLILAAGKSSVIADALIARACRGASKADDALAVAAAQALGQGALASAASKRQLIARLMPLLQFGNAEAWRVFRLLVTLAVPPDLQDATLLAIQQSFSHDHDVVARAAASLNWNWDRERRNEYLERALRIHTLPTLKRRVARSGIDLDTLTDRLLMRIKEQAASILLPTRPDVAPLVAHALERSSFTTFQTLSQLLRDHGHGDLVTDAVTHIFKSGKLFERIALSARQAREDIDEFLATLVSYPAPAALSLSQERRLRELASCIESLNLNEISAWMEGDKWRPLRKQFMHVITALGGFDEAVLAAQAAIVQREIAASRDGSYDSFFSLFDVASKAELEHWDDLTDIDATTAFLVRMLHAPRGAAVVAATALATHPDAESTAGMIEVSLTGLPHRSVLPATWAYLSLAREADEAVDALAHSTDANIREAVARLVPLAQDGRRTMLASLLAADPVRQVRLAVIEEFRTAKPNAEIIALLQSMAVSEDTAFLCYHCGTRNPALSDSCSSCRAMTGRPSNEATRLLDTLRKSQPS